MGQARSRPNSPLASFVKESPFREFCYALRRPNDPDLETTATRVRPYYEYLALNDPDLAQQIVQCGATNPNSCRAEYDSKDFPTWRCGNDLNPAEQIVGSTLESDDLLGIVFTWQYKDQIACLSRSALMHTWSTEKYVPHGVRMDLKTGNEYGAVVEFHELTLADNANGGGGTFLVTDDALNRLEKHPHARLWRLRLLGMAKMLHGDTYGASQKIYQLSPVLLQKDWKAQVNNIVRLDSQSPYRVHKSSMRGISRGTSRQKTSTALYDTETRTLAPPVSQGGLVQGTSRPGTPRPLSTARSVRACAKVHPLRLHASARLPSGKPL